jgi:hypothetical protein
MTRGDHKIRGTPYRLWIAQVDRQHRVRLTRSEIQSTIPWLNVQPGTIECMGTLGPAGGIQIEPSVAHQALERRFIEALGDQPVESPESGHGWVDIARLFATTWSITVNIESSRINITLPEPTRRTLLLPRAGGMAAVFGFDGILEVWDAIRWHDHVRAIAKMKSSAFSRALEDLGDR